tara:strand:+ start:184 stop:465 length:282 start_codon:yes stop_codon:yes gene_type:complete
MSTLGKEHTPRWNIVEKLYNKIDKTIDTAFADNKCSFLEIEITMLMVKEKLSQQKHEMYSLYLQHKDEEEEPKDEKKATDKKDKKDAPANVYG